MKGALAVAPLVLTALAAAQDRPVPIPAPLPTTAVDASAFPANSPARYEAPRRALFVSTRGHDDAPGTKDRPLASIRRALEAGASDGPVAIWVDAGAYLEGSPDDDFALRIEADGTVVSALPGQAVTVRPSGEGVTGGVAIAASRVTLRGISLEGFRSTGIAIGAEGRTLEDLVIASGRVAMPEGGDGVLVWPDHRDSGRPVVSGLLLEDVEVLGASIGVQVGSGPAWHVALVGVAIRNRSNPGGDSGADAFAIESGDDILVNGGEFTGAEGDGIDLKATRCAVLAVHVHHVGRNGIKLWHEGDVIDALVHDCGADASVVLGSKGAGEVARFRIVHSLVAFHGRASGESAYSMSVAYDSPQDPVELELVDTVFHGNAGGIVLSKGTRATILGCLLGPGPAGQVVEYAHDGSTSRSVEATDGPEALSLVGRAEGNLAFGTRPGFVRADASDLVSFVPGRGSPLVGAGVAVLPAVGVDLAGSRRPKGRPAIGPLEPR